MGPPSSADGHRAPRAGSSVISRRGSESLERAPGRECKHPCDRTAPARDPGRPPGICGGAACRGTASRLGGPPRQRSLSLPEFAGGLRSVRFWPRVGSRSVPHGPRPGTQTDRAPGADSVRSKRQEHKGRQTRYEARALSADTPRADADPGRGEGRDGRQDALPANDAAGHPRVARECLCAASPKDPGAQSWGGAGTGGGGDPLP